MKIIKKGPIFLGFSSLLLLMFCFSSGTGDDEKAKIIKNVRKTLSMHYEPKLINDDFSKNVFHRYIENLDPLKRFFTQADITEFKKSELFMDDYFYSEELEFYNKTVDTYYTRIEEAKELTESIFKEGLRYDESETYDTNEEKRKFAFNTSDWKKEWKKYLKYNVLLEAYNMKTGNKTDSIDSSSTDKNSHLSQKELLEKAEEKVQETFSDYFRRLLARKKDDMFSYYINAFTEEYDPHTTYFSPKDAEDFDASISGKFEGIGATLQDKKGYPTITSLIIGGPAWKSEKLEAGDKIIKVAQGKDDPVNVVGMLLDDAIRLIRGKKGSTVVLTIQKKDGSITEVPIVRDEIELEESYARSAIITDKNGNKFGLINFSQFYVDLNQRNGRNVSDDIKKEILELKKENIKGLILDIRNNGGGSLGEVVEIVGHFIPTGPVVQVKENTGRIKELDDENPEIVWDGPLTVMVNELSASASEILAGAIQDYNRGVIVGSPQTYGKGTVQTILPLDRFSFSNDNLGELKMTIQKYYRVSGNSTQLKGVTPDIVMVDSYTYIDANEGAQENAMAWDQIAPLSYKNWDVTYSLEKLKEHSQKRTSGSEYIATVEKGAQWIKSFEDNSQVPLKYDAFMSTMDAREKESEYFDYFDSYTNNLSISSPEYEKPLFKTDTVFKARREDWHKDLLKDYYLNETINVLKDMTNP